MFYCILTLMVLYPPHLFAHGLIGHNISDGFVGSIGGWTNLLILFGIGILTSKRSGNRVTLFIVTFLIANIAAYLSCIVLDYSFPEQITACTIIFIGILLFTTDRYTLYPTLLAILISGIVHGYTYSLLQDHSIHFSHFEFISVSTGIYIMGIILGLIFKLPDSPSYSFRVSGFVITLPGLIFLIYTVL